MTRRSKSVSSIFVAAIALGALGCSSGADDAADGSLDRADAGAHTPGAGDAGTGETYWPGETWETRAPEAVGLQAEDVDAAMDFALRNGNTQAVAIIHQGYIVAEAFARGFTATQRHESYSVAKSFTSGLVGIAIEQGALSDTDVRVCEFYDAWDCDADHDPRSRVTIAHLMGLTSGLDWNEDWGEGGSLLNNDAIRMSQSPRPIDYVLAKAARTEPGTEFQYSTGDPALLSGVLQTATGQTALAFAREHMLTPIGAEGIEWNADADGRTRTYAGLQATLHEYARFGLLYLRGGRWQGEQIVPASWVERTTQPGGTLVDWYNDLWHVNLPSRFEDPDLPADGFAAAGVMGQFVTILPSEDLLIVRLAEDPFGGAEFDMAGLIRRVLAAKR